MKTTHNPLFKTLLIILISAGAGFFIGAYCDPRADWGSFKKNNDESLISTILSNEKDSVKAAQTIRDSIINRHKIGKDIAMQLIANYADYDKKWYNTSLRVDTVDSVGNNHLKSYFISKVLLDAIFKSNSRFNGIRLFMAKEHADNKKIFTFVIAGSHATTEPKTGPDDLYFNYVDTCPNNCN